MSEDPATVDDYWDRTWPIVRIATIALFALCAVGGTMSPADGAWAVLPALLGGAMIAVFWLGSPRTGAPHDLSGYPWAVVAMLVTLYGLFTAAVVASPVFFFSIFALFWLTWSMLELRFAAPVAVVLTAVLIALQVRGGSALTDATVSGAVSFGFGLLLAVFVRRTIDESNQRSDLIAKLEAAQGRLASVERDAGRLAERTHLAHEIHDTLAQGFTSIVMLSQAAQANLDAADVPSATGRLQSIERTARENLAEARHLVAELTPPALHGGSLADAIARVVDGARRDQGLAATFEASGAPHPLDPAAEVVLLRVAQEGLANARKHAQAREVSVVLSYGPDAVRLEVVDDGVGFDPAAATDGYGLQGMRARIEEIGGVLHVSSGSDVGTRVVAVLP